MRNLLLTGLPGRGKTTIIRRLAGRLDGLRLASFQTQEIREQGQRVGFESVLGAGPTPKGMTVAAPGRDRDRPFLEKTRPDG
jgi:nucleoside-triphosphatase